MVKWLEGGDGAPSDAEIWGFVHQNYTFEDLKDYITCVEAACIAKVSKPPKQKVLQDPDSSPHAESSKKARRDKKEDEDSKHQNKDRKRTRSARK